MTDAERAVRIDAALQALIEIRQPPSDLAHVATTLERPFAGDTVTRHGPYIDGPAMSLTSAEDAPSRTEVRELLETATRSVAGDEAATAALELFDRFEQSSDLAARAPNPALQAAAAFTAARSGDMTFFAPGSNRRLIFPTAEPTVGLSPETEAALASAFRPRPLTGAFTIITRDIDGSETTTINPIWRYADPRTLMTLLPAAVLDCTVFSPSCVYATEGIVAWTWVDLVTADPSLALDRTQEVRELNTAAMQLLNSAGAGDPGPATFPTPGLGLFPGSAEATTLPDTGLRCPGQGDGADVDCWVAIYNDADSAIESYNAAFTSLGRTLEEAQTSPLAGEAGLEILLGLDEPVTPLEELAGDDPSELDDLFQAAVPLEQNVLFRLVLGLIGPDDVAEVAEANGITIADIERRLVAEIGAPTIEQIAGLRGEAYEPAVDRRIATDVLGSVESTYTTTTLVREDGYRVTLARYEVADLTIGDVITPIDDGVTEIRHPDGSRTIAGDDETVIRVPDDATPDQPKVTIEQGTVIHERAEDADGEPVEFSLPGFETRTEDGAFVVECDDDGTCFLVALQGIVTVTTPDGQVIELEPADAIEVSADGEVLQQTTVLLAQLTGSERLRLIAELHEIDALDFGDEEQADDPFPVEYSSVFDVLVAENVNNLEGGAVLEDVIRLTIQNKCTTALRCELELTLSQFNLDVPVSLEGDRIEYEGSRLVQAVEEDQTDSNWNEVVILSVTERSNDGLPAVLVGTVDAQTDDNGAGVVRGELRLERSEANA